MAILEIVSFIEIIRKLVERKSELDQKYFEQFIQPAWNAFIKIHTDYKDSFKKYSALLANEEIELQYVIEQIRQDSIYTRDMRSELSKLIKHLPSSRMKVKEEHVADFVKAITDYFFTRFEGPRMLDNVLRHEAIMFLSRKGYSLDRPVVEDEFEKLMILLQNSYEKVAETYYRLRKELLV